MIISRMILIYSLLLTIGSLFFIKSNVQKLNRELIAVESEIIKEKDNLHILKAELTHLAKPQLVEKLAAKYLNLQAMDSSQLVIIELSDPSTPKVFENKR